MMASPSELSLDCKPHSYSMLLKSMTNGDDQQTDQTQKLQEFLSRLEQERLKIDAFKRELPLCMQLLSNVMETSRQQLQNFHANQGVTQPILEEFIPLKNSSSEESDKSSKLSMSLDNKATWMTSAQLWNDPNGTNQTLISSKETDHISLNNSTASPKLGLDSKPRNGNGAFIPFSKERNFCPNPNLHSLPDLVLASVDKDVEDKKFLENESNGLPYQRRDNSVKGGGDVSDSQTNSATPTISQTHRKARRCWSPDLHRRFVNALQMLGGSQVATPKQIRELMKVDCLTNDEVKSHLQKYRLHTRRPSPSPQTAGNPTPQLVVLGSIWVPPEYATAAAAAHHSGATATLYGTHPNNPHYCAQQVTQDFYQAQVQQQQQQLHHHTMHHQLQMYKPSSHSHSSPGSDLRSGTHDRSESIEDGKSESGGSWKADSSGENAGERKALVVREGGEESNGSEITLKF